MYRILFFVLIPIAGLSGQINLEYLNTQIDSLVQIGLDSQAYPGCQIVVMHQSELVFKKSYGHHTYSGIRTVKDTDLYDLASVTKVTTGLPLLMWMHSNGQFNPEEVVQDDIPKLKGSNKADLTWLEVLSHQAGLVPWLPHWQNTLRKNKKKFRSRSFRYTTSNAYNIKVSNGLYLHRRYPKKMARAIRNSDLGTKEYLYSGLFFYLMPEMIGKKFNTAFDELLYTKIYDPIGAVRLKYRPLDYFPKEEIVPTEIDTFFRHQLVQGMVHDEGAAMMNGISCNAGLFGNAEDLAKLGNLYCQYGSFNNEQIIAENSVKYFGTAHFASSDNRRGLGFDKPLLQPDKDWIGPCGPSASPESFGHSGFTGTYMWIDPTKDLVFIFLSNRVHPTRTNRKLYSMNIRQLLHEACYNAISN